MATRAATFDNGDAWKVRMTIFFLWEQRKTRLFLGYKSPLFVMELENLKITLTQQPQFGNIWCYYSFRMSK